MSSSSRARLASAATRGVAVTVVLRLHVLALLLVVIRLGGTVI